MCKSLSDLLQSAEKLAASFDPDLVHPKDQPSYLQQASRLEKIASSIKTLVAAKISQSGNWRQEGDKSAADFVSRKTGETVRGAVDLIETGRALRELPSTDQAFRSGRLTQEQTQEIVTAAVISPSCEKDLIEVAEKQGLVGVRKEARRVQAAADADHKERALRLNRQRYLRTWVQVDGAFRLSAQLTPEAGAEVQAVLDAWKRKLGKPSSIRTEDQLGADALLDMARSSATGEKVDAVVRVRVDLDGLARGYLTEGEVCEAIGVGPISVEGAREFLNGGLLRWVGLRGGEVRTIDNAGRHVPDRLKTAIEEEFPRCCVEGCNATRDLERDHVQDFPSGGRTKFANLRPFCRKHHRMKHGPYRLVPLDGGRSFRLERIVEPNAWSELRVDSKPEESSLPDETARRLVKSGKRSPP